MTEVIIMSNINFANAIKEIRKVHHLTQDELSEKLGINRTGVTYWENGRSIPSKQMLDKICELFNVDYNFLLGDYKLTKKTRIPILGTVPCGEAIEAIEDVVGYIDADVELGQTKSTFALYAKGDSMYPEIKDGDILVIKYSPIVESGKIAIVKVNGYDATCKRITYNDQGIVLYPINPEYQPQMYSRSDVSNLPIQVIGQVIEIRRKI